MKHIKSILFCVVLLCCVLFLTGDEAQAQSGYGLTVFNYDVDGGKVYGTSQTYLDYDYLGYWYNAGVEGFLIRYTDETLQNYEIIRYGYNQHDYNAVVLTDSNVQRGQIYAVFSHHHVQTLSYAGSGYYWDPYGLSYNSFYGRSVPSYGFQLYPQVYIIQQWRHIATTGVIVALPNVTSISPDAGAAGFNLIVQLRGKYIGEHFEPLPSPIDKIRATVSGDGVVARPTITFPEGVEFGFEIAADAEPGNRSVRLYSDNVPANLVTYRVGDRTPVIESMTPPQARTGEQVEVTINGTGFGANPLVQIDGLGVSQTTSMVSPTQIRAVFSVANNTYQGDRNVTVKSRGRSGTGFAPAPGNSDTSNAKPFNVTTPIVEVNVTEVGFTNDYTIRRYPSLIVAIDEPDGSTPTWRRSGSNNDKNYVAYKKGTNPKAFAKFTITSTTEASTNALIRIKIGGNVITNQNIPVTLSGNTVSVNDITINASALENQPVVKKGTYNFDWEFSLDNGQNWKTAGTSAGHIIFWTYGTVEEPNNCIGDAVRRSCLFVNDGDSDEYDGLYDKALEKAISELPLDQSTQNPVAQTPDQIAKVLAYNIDAQIPYNPNTIEPDDEHPLQAYTKFVRDGVQCAVNANLLRGLLRSIGVNNAETIYVWGGKPENNDKKETETGGLVYGFRNLVYSSQGVGESYVSLQAIRPANNEGFVLPTDPPFTFHAMVKIFDTPENGASNLNARYYDPSYGKRLQDNAARYPDYPYINNNLKFRKVVNLDNPKPKFLNNDATKPYFVRALSLNDFCLPNRYTTCTRYPKTKVTNKVGTSMIIAAIPRTSNFDDQNVTNISVWRPSNGVWYAQDSLDSSMIAFQWGQNGDKIAPGDYDGDGVTDYAVFRSSTSSLWIFQSESQTARSIQWNSATDKPVTGDFDGDGKTDVAFYRPDNTGSKWNITRSSDNSSYTLSFGAIEDRPVSGDFDGDGKTDVAVYRPSSGTWWWWQTTDGTWKSLQFGASNDIPVQGDYDGDGKTDFAVYHPANSRWSIRYSSRGNTLEVQLGTTGDMPVPGDYDGDAKTDVAVWSGASGRWSIINSSDGTTIEAYWGSQTLGDIPIPAAFMY